MYDSGIQMAVLSGITLEYGNEQFWGLDLWHHTWNPLPGILEMSVVGKLEETLLTYFGKLFPPE